ncbi:MAG: cysteine desulfurase [Clostridia bacterium]|nr:cysteine desulfurase [Clostridia bacterium]
MIYFDNAATTKPDEQSLKQAEKYLLKEFYNPSALYSEGHKINLELKQAALNVLSQIADINNFSVIFTSGGTEADNQAVFCGGKRGNVVTTLGEHSAIYSAVNELKQRGIEVRFANLNSDGSVNVKHLLSLIDAKTSLVSVIHVNNETGAINDILEIAKRVKAKNQYTLFHSDGVQAYGKISFRLSADVDMYSVGAHKIGGIKGCGALIKRKNLILKPYIFGGGQQQGLRSGTENIFGIKCFEYASIDRYAKLKENYEKVKEIKEIIVSKLDKNLFKVVSPLNGSPYILTVSAVGLRGETIMHEADDSGLIIGTGSACSSNANKRFSRVILACGFDEKVADGVLRLSFSPSNTENEAYEAAEILNKIVKHRKEVME